MEIEKSYSLYECIRTAIYYRLTEDELYSLVFGGWNPKLTSDISFIICSIMTRAYIERLNDGKKI